MAASVGSATTGENIASAAERVNSLCGEAREVSLFFKKFYPLVSFTLVISQNLCWCFSITPVSCFTPRDEMWSPEPGRLEHSMDCMLRAELSVLGDTGLDTDALDSLRKHVLVTINKRSFLDNHCSWC